MLYNLSGERTPLGAGDKATITIEVAGKTKAIEPLCALVAAAVEKPNGDGALGVEMSWIGTAGSTREVAIAVAVAALDQLHRTGVLHEALECYDAILTARAASRADAAAHPPQTMH